MKTLEIIKIGGKIINDDELLDKFIQSFSQIGGAKILVHGGGRAATELSAILGLKPKMINGRRITDKETLRVATMVYAGLVNKSIVVKLQAHDCQALGLSGADGNLIQSHKREVKDIDYGYVGDIDAVNTALLQQLIVAGYTPVICPLTHDKQGQLLNTNADTIAAQVTRAMSTDYAVKLKYCFEYNGVLKDLDDQNSILSTVSSVDIKTYIKDGTFSDGMIPKAENAFDALHKGASQVNICGIAHVHESNPGTQFII